MAEFFDRGVGIALRLKDQTGKKLKDFKAHLEAGPSADAELQALRNDVVAFSRTVRLLNSTADPSDIVIVQFPTVGFDESSMKFPEEPSV